MKTKNLHRQEVHISYTCKAATTDIAELLCGECLWPRLPQPPDTARRDTRGSASYSDEFKDALLDGEALLYGLMVISPCLLAARKKLSGSQNILCNDLHLVANLVGDRKPHLLYTQDGNLACIASLCLQHPRLAVFVSGYCGRTTPEFIKQMSSTSSLPSSGAVSQDTTRAWDFRPTHAVAQGNGVEETLPWRIAAVTLTDVSAPQRRDGLGLLP